MDCLSKFGKFILVSLNTLFLIISLILIVLGALVKWGQSVFKQYLDPLLRGVAKGTEGAGLGEIDLSQFDIGVILGDVAVALIVIGVILLLIAIFGCCGACCQVRWMLVIYGIVVSAIFLAQVIIVVLLFVKTEKMRELIKKPMKISIEDSFRGFNSTDIVSLGWNFAMMTFGCCGADSYLDFQNSTTWHRTYYLESYNTTVELLTPVACCKVSGTFPNFQPPSNYNCTFEPNANNSNYQMGCYQSIEDFVFKYDKVFIGVGCVFGIFQLALVFFTFYLCHAISKEQNEVKPYK